MENIYDFIKEFYNQDPEWNEILPEEVCEGYIRRISWQGADEKRRQQVWEYLLSLMLYSGYSATMPGDLTPDDCVVMVGWCCRNMGEFSNDDEYLKDFYAVMEDFFQYMYFRHSITHCGVMAKAAKKLFGQGRRNVLGVDGFFREDLENYNKRGIPDLPSRLFVDMNAQMIEAIQILQEDWLRKHYSLDYDRAVNFYETIVADGQAGSSERDNSYGSFIDYFCFDYPLLANGRPLIEDLSRKINSNLSDKYSRPLQCCFQELAKAKCCAFIVTKDLGGGAFSVVDVLRNQSQVMMLPLEPGANTEDVLFYAHVFCDNTMLVNFLRGSPLTAVQKDKLCNLFRKLKQYYAVRKGGKCSWDDFLDQNRLLVRTLPVLLGSNVPLKADFVPNIIGYTPAEDGQDRGMQRIVRRVMPNYLFSEADVSMVLQIWYDLCRAEQRNPKKAKNKTLDGVALVRLYVNLCGVFNFNDNGLEDEEIKDACQEVQRRSEEIEKILQIVKYDSRYVSTEGLCFMVAQIRRESDGGE